MIESTIEKFVIELLEAQGFEYIYAPDVLLYVGCSGSYDVSSLSIFSTTGRRSSQGGISQGGISQGGISRGWYEGKNLPHYDEYGLMQSITFRLCDSLPLTKREELEEEIKGLSNDKKDIHKRKQIEKWLDEGFGCCALSNPEMADVMEKALIYYDGSKYNLICWCVMPNHVHFIISPFNELGVIIKLLKSYTSKWAYSNLGDEWLPKRKEEILRRGRRSSQEEILRRGRRSSQDNILRRGRRSSQGEHHFWMPDYWDRYIRDENHFNKAVEYIHNNPVKAGLCKRAEDWLWSSAKYWKDSTTGTSQFPG